MGPMALFDKSFIQSLSENESVWFDHFFLTNVCPLFYVETLADLEKPTKSRSARQEVAIIARKYPETQSGPCAYHQDLVVGDLLGQYVPMTGQVPLATSRLVEVHGEVGAVSEDSPVADAFQRWQRQESLQIERLYASAWRKSLGSAGRGYVTSVLWPLGLDAERCKTLEAAKRLADSVMSDNERARALLDIALSLPDIREHDRLRIAQRWSAAGSPPLARHAPYAAFVLGVDVFFALALAASLISGERPSNRVDIAYLYYLPFCVLFVSSDKLHRSCAPLFLREDQEFVWGGDLKKDLGSIDVHYQGLPVEVRERGIWAFASYPPQEGRSLVASLWDRHLPGWRQTGADKPPKRGSGPAAVLDRVRSMRQSPTISHGEVTLDPRDVRGVVVQHRVRRVKGSWYQVPRDHPPD